VICTKRYEVYFAKPTSAFFNNSNAFYRFHIVQGFLWVVENTIMTECFRNHCVDCFGQVLQSSPGTKIIVATDFELLRVFRSIQIFPIKGTYNEFHGYDMICSDRSCLRCYQKSGENRGWKACIFSGCSPLISGY